MCVRDEESESGSIVCERMCVGVLFTAESESEIQERERKRVETLE